MMDRATPNLPSRGFAGTSEFYRQLGFVEGFRDDTWMILTRGSLTLEFFLYPALNPLESSFSCCFRLDDLAAFHALAQAAGVPERRVGQPRIHPPALEASGLTIAYLVDPDGSLIRLIQN